MVPAERFGKHDRADFAQEFLRRNADYRAAWRAQAGVSGVANLAVSGMAEAARWGLVSLFDPDDAVRAAPAFWSLDCASLVVPLQPVGVGFPGAARLPAQGRFAMCRTPGRVGLVVDAAGARHRLSLLGGDLDAPVAVLLPPRGDALCAAACETARRALGGYAAGAAAAALRPSALQRRRLALLLCVHDAWVAGASIREIGLEIVYPWLTSAEAFAWKASSERRRVQRLVAETRDLVAFGYRALLRA